MLHCENSSHLILRLLLSYEKHEARNITQNNISPQQVIRSPFGQFSDFVFWLLGSVNYCLVIGKVPRNDKICKLSMNYLFSLVHEVKVRIKRSVFKQSAT